MDMILYVQEVKRQFRDVFGITPTGGDETEPLFDHIPNGIYPMKIDGKEDFTVVVEERMFFFMKMNVPKREAVLG